MGKLILFWLFYDFKNIGLIEELFIIDIFDNIKPVYLVKMGPIFVCSPF